MNTGEELQIWLSLLTILAGMSFLLSLWKFSLLRELRRLNHQAMLELVKERERIDLLSQRLDRMEDRETELQAMLAHLLEKAS